MRKLAESLLVFVRLAVVVSSKDGLCHHPCKHLNSSTASLLQRDIGRVATPNSAQRLSFRYKVISGVPVHNYHQRSPVSSDSPPGHLHSERPVSVLDIDEDHQIDWLINFPSDATATEMHACCGEVTGAAKCLFEGHRHGVHVVTIRASERDLKEVLSKHCRGVRFVEPNLRMRLIDDLEVSEAGVSAQLSQVPWGLDRIDDTAGLDNSYDVVDGGNGVDVFVMDTGIRMSHEDFEGRAVPFYDAVSDTICSPGSSTCSGDWHSHGTHCAGTIGGKTKGVAKKAALHSAMVVDPSNGWIYLAQLVKAMDLVVNSNKQRAIMSMSIYIDDMGDGRDHGTDVSTIQTAVDDAVASGVAVVVAAGNQQTDSCNYWPQGVHSSINVGATDSLDRPASFTNYGSCVDIYAPGVDILSAGHLWDSHFARMSGTSMACPHVAGAIAVLMARYPEKTTAEIKQFLMGSSIQIGVDPDPSESRPMDFLYINPTTEPTPEMTPEPTARESTSEPTPEPTPEMTPEPTTRESTSEPTPDLTQEPPTPETTLDPTPELGNGSSIR